MTNNLIDFAYLCYKLDYYQYELKGPRAEEARMQLQTRRSVSYRLDLLAIPFLGQALATS